MKRSILWIPALIAATIPLWICAAEPDASAGVTPALLGNKVVRCKMGSSDAALPEAVRGNCYSLRPNGPAMTILVGAKEHEYFATSCTVSLIRGTHQDSKCTERDLIRRGDELAIIEWGNKEAYSLSINRRGGPSPQMVATNLPLTKHMRHGDLVWLEAHNPAANATYYIYLQHATVGNDHPKKYVVEAFSDDMTNPDYQECAKERPGVQGNIGDLAACPSMLVDPEIKENNTGGGGEPPPDPR